MSRTVRLVALAVLVLAVATASGAFTTTSADRGATVSVVTDDRMLLGVETQAPELANGRHDDVVLMVVTNQFPGELTLTSIKATDTESDSQPPRIRPGSVTTPASLSGGESGTVTADIVCAGRSSATDQLVVEVTVSDGTVRFSATRTVKITCTGPRQPSNGDGEQSGESANARSTATASR